jgi:MFS family permease
MALRWRVLVLLFAVRTTMAFQFQTVGALGPLVRADFGVGLADLGLLIGLYLSPGIVLALPSGTLGRRFGDKPCVLGGLLLMVVGGLVMAFGVGWPAQLSGRLLAGFGGVLLNVLMSKMVTDWFAGREIATAMAIYVNSWPFGIAIALMTLPFAGAALGVHGAYLISVAAAAFGAMLLLALYQPATGGAGVGAQGGVPTGRPAAAIVFAGLTWGLYNGAVGMVFSFGNSLLAERGWTLAAAGGVTSLALWLTMLSVALGGVLADRTGRYGTVLIGGFLAFALMLGVAARTDAALPAFAGIGFVCGLPAGAIMSLPTRVLTVRTRAVGMGIFWTMFYLIVVSSPWIGGWLAGATGGVASAFDFGSLLLLLACACYFAFVPLAGSYVATVRA